MEHMAWKGRIKPGCKAEYQRRHAEIWPEMVKVLKEAGICNYSIFYCKDELFGYYEFSIIRIKPDGLLQSQEMLSCVFDCPVLSLHFYPTGNQILVIFFYMVILYHRNKLRQVLLSVLKFSSTVRTWTKRIPTF